MRRSILGVVILLAVASVSRALAQEQSAPEAMAVIKDGEVGRLERDSLKAYGEIAHFDVSIVWDDAAGPRPAGHTGRRVRYVADCKAATLVVAAVSVFDASGKLVKTLILPPGAVDPVQLQKGSPEARWLREVCRL